MCFTFLNLKLAKEKKIRVLKVFNVKRAFLSSGIDENYISKKSLSRGLVSEDVRPGSRSRMVQTSCVLNCPPNPQKGRENCCQAERR